MTKIKDTNEPWQSGLAKNITFIVTKDCQLACKNCYFVGKNVKERMPCEVTNPDFAHESVEWDFIGGEPFLEIELIDKFCDHIAKGACSDCSRMFSILCSCLCQFLL